MTVKHLYFVLFIIAIGFAVWNVLLIGWLFAIWLSPAMSFVAGFAAATLWKALLGLLVGALSAAIFGESAL